MEITDCFSWKESSSRMPRLPQSSANFWYQNITESQLLFNLSSFPICNSDLG